MQDEQIQEAINGARQYAESMPGLSLTAKAHINGLCEVLEATRKQLEAAERLYSEAPRLLGDLEYAAHNLCDETEDDVSRVIESTCPERTLLIAIRDMRALMKEGS